MTSKCTTKLRIRPEYPQFVVEREQIWTEEKRIIDMIGPEWLGRLFDAMGMAPSHYEEVTTYSSWQVLCKFRKFEDAEKYVLDRLEKEEKRAIEAPVFNAQEIVYYPKARTLAGALAEQKEAATKITHASKWHHVKSGHNYVVHGFCIREADLVVMVKYRRVTGDPFETAWESIEWSRPYSEFIDGRFERIDLKHLLPNGEDHI